MVSPGGRPDSTPRRRVLVALAMLVVSCGGVAAPPAPIPSESDARAYLDRLVATVALDGAEGVCRDTQGICQQSLSRADPARVPEQPPLVIGTRVLQPGPAGDGWSAGGRVLELCGIDGLGERYYSELLVFEEAGRLTSIGTPYWLGIGITESADVGAPRSPRPCP